jgi:hypothetical protein
LTKSSPKSKSIKKANIFQEEQKSLTIHNLLISQVKIVSHNNTHTTQTTMPVGSGTNSNMNGIRIESRVLAPPGGFSSISFGGESSNEDKFKGHNFNPKSQKKISEQQQRDEENTRPVPRNVRGGNSGSSIPGLETTHHPVKPQQQQQATTDTPTDTPTDTDTDTAPVLTSQPLQQQQETQLFPGRRGRGAGESTFSLGWE